MNKRENNLIARLDERVKGMEKRLPDMHGDVKDILTKINGIKSCVHKNELAIKTTAQQVKDHLEGHKTGYVILGIFVSIVSVFIHFLLAGV